ncbi:hypothetical protein [Chitinolyticbacter albus]|uniref:hypothetical protein n=1 Tax=Chitinolyticbacter albus TaxID=2961951 RepID=UPI00210A68B6|nr:hypothetical protein [Chitinolyticbacter albus]
MIRIRYSPGEVELEGTQISYLAIRNQIIRIANSDEIGASLESESGFDPAPYGQALIGLDIVKNKGPILAITKGDRLEISGSPEFLLVLASNLPWENTLRNLAEPYHIHFDAAGWPNEISVNSAEMVFSLTR